MATQFVTAASVREALEAKGAGCAYLAGGTEINRLDSSVEADTLISLRKLEELKEVKEKNDFVCIGSLCTFQQALEEEIVPEWFKDACRFMGSRTKRNMATIGGNIAIKRTDSYLLPTLIAADAKLALSGADGDKVVTVLEYVKGDFDELITHVCVPADPGFVKSVRYSNTVQSHAYLTVAFAAKDLDHINMAAAVKGGGIYHLTDLAAAMEKDHDVTEETLVNMVYDCDGAVFPTDMFGSEKYKRYLLGVTAAILLSDAKKGGLA
ncbi:MAG: FAD binding domain-containing protein [Lachnospiraceae bacterium]|nr:FAD binding domain-containing protein [Lachnospiraceae bacterium]